MILGTAIIMLVGGWALLWGANNAIAPTEKEFPRLALQRRIAWVIVIGGAGMALISMLSRLIR